MKIIMCLRLTVITMIIALFAYSCDDFKDQSPEILEESAKDISGSWKIVKASRNGSDITSSYDFSKFRLNFNEDKSYTIDNYLPFLVRLDGTWETNDNHYPFKIIFEEKNASEPVISTLIYPISGNGRKIKLTFSPGCHANSYTYEFEKVSN